jgi:hypothetical protein
MMDKGLPVRKWCALDVVKSNGGWMPDETLAAKKRDMTPEDYDIEVLMKAPSSRDQIFSEAQIDNIMPLELGPAQTGVEEQRVTLIPPHPKLVFVHGSDWGKSRHWSVFTVLTEDPNNPGGQLFMAAWERWGGGNNIRWPRIKKAWATLRQDYRGLRESGVASDYYYAVHDATGMGGKAIDDEF